MADNTFEELNQINETDIAQVQKLENALAKVSSYIISNNVKFPRRQEAIRNQQHSFSYL